MRTVSPSITTDYISGMEFLSGSRARAVQSCAVVGDEKQVQLLGMMNRLLDRHPKARQRCLAWSTPVVIPLWPNVGLPVTLL